MTSQKSNVSTTLKLRGASKRQTSAKSKNSFSDFITQPWVAAAFLIFAFVTLILSLREFTTVRGF